MAMTPTSTPRERNSTIGWRVRFALLALLAIAALVVWQTNSYLTERFRESTRNRADLRLALHSGNLLSELRSNAIVPQLLARDAELIGALRDGDYSRSTQRLIGFVEEIGAANLFLMDKDGRVVAATDRTRISANLRDRPHFLDALRSNATVFSVIPREASGYHFYYSRRVQFENETIGVIAVEANLAKFERAWAGITAAVLVTDSEGQIILATEPRWRGLNEDEALERQDPVGAIERAIKATADWTALPADAYLAGEAMMRSTARVGFRGWRIVSFTNYASVRERVNGVGVSASP